MNGHFISFAAVAGIVNNASHDEAPSRYRFKLAGHLSSLLDAARDTRVSRGAYLVQVAYAQAGIRLLCRCAREVHG